jgi:hypothetical protein
MGLGHGQLTACAGAKQSLQHPTIKGKHTMNRQKRKTVAWICGALLTAYAPHAAVAADPVVLRIYAPVAASQGPGTASSGTLTNDVAPVASYGMAFIKSLPQHSFVAQTPWYKKPVKFTGPLLRDVLAAAKVRGETINAVAIDDYRTKIPFSDSVLYHMVLAHQIDGETLTPKNKGPLFVVYPYDSKPELQSVRFYERSIWQLKSLRLE